MKKIYESPKAEVINFTAMEQLASLRLEVSLTNEDGVTGDYSVVNRGTL